MRKAGENSKSSHWIKERLHMCLQLLSLLSKVSCRSSLLLLHSGANHVPRSQWSVSAELQSGEPMDRYSETLGYRFS